MSIETVNKDPIIEMGRSICDHINNTRSYYESNVFVDPDNYFWAEGSVLQEIIGREEAFDELCFNFPPGAPDYYDRNKEIIRRYFKPGSLTLQQATHLHAPIEEVASEFWPSELVNVDPQDLNPDQNNAPSNAARAEDNEFDDLMNFWKENY